MDLQLGQQNVTIQNYPTRLKIITIGNQGVGKTSIIQYLQDGSFSGQQNPTIGLDLITVERVWKNIKYTIDIWDTAGQEKFSAMVASYCKGCDAMIYVFAFNDKESYDNLKDKWINNTEEYWKKRYSLHDHWKQNLDSTIDPIQIQNLYESMNCIYIETSAMSGRGVQEAFEILINMILVKKENPNKIFDSSITLKQFGFDTSLTIKANNENSIQIKQRQSQNQNNEHDNKIENNNNNQPSNIRLDQDLECDTQKKNRKKKNVNNCC